MSRFILVCSLLVLGNFVYSVPFSPSAEDLGSGEFEENSTKIVNGSGPDLIVIKTIVYEVGILTDDSNNTNGSNETQEVVNLTFFDPKHNDSFIDLSNIPVPFQTNVSGVTLTGVAPADFGAIKLQEDGTPTLNGSSVPILPNKQVKVTHNITTINENDSALLLDNLSGVLGLKLNKSQDKNVALKSSTSKTTDAAPSSTSVSTTEKTTESSSSGIVA